MRWIKENWVGLVGTVASLLGYVVAWFNGLEELWAANPGALAVTMVASFALGWAACWWWRTFSRRGRRRRLLEKMASAPPSVIDLLADFYEHGGELDVPGGDTRAKYLADAGILSFGPAPTLAFKTRCYMTDDAYFALRQNPTAVFGDREDG